MRKLMILALTGIAMLTNSVKAQKIYDFVSVEKQPAYPGGIVKFYQYMKNEIKYPEVAKNNKIQGKVFLSFIVEKNGKLTDVIVVRSLSKETDAEAVRVIKNSPNWNPGVLDGMPVRVKYNIAVNFNFSGDKTSQKTSNKPGLTPEFPGGTEKLYSYLAKNIKYPKEAQKNNVQGKVFLEFNVEKNGTLTDIVVTRGLSKETDAEAMRVMRAAPRWNPAIGTDGHPVKTKYRMTVNFTLS
ncbi:energy transducer TonB [Pedobacter sp. MC2016-05]|uniref:energy transducer TonB n=1 Tax=Pedobacter sp. MC2016-05 TaxID=2994474 RepID=UPI00224565F2|nr:energy transducer TonB [Pedobacter sp. MC2016-05]MCX2474274.1 energy transducer TonB [Pedobacter sp. MC2016-05]